MNYVWISAAGLCGSTILGALLGFGIKKVPHKWNDTILGFCAGMMLAAAILGLIVPAMEGANVINNKFGWLLVVAGVMIGALFLNVLDATLLDGRPRYVETNFDIALNSTVNNELMLSLTYKF